MEIVWDEPKRLANLAKHRMDFADLDLAFFESAVIDPAHSGRFRALGRIGDDVVAAIIFRPLGSEALSVISMRRASTAERRLLDDRQS